MPPLRRRGPSTPVKRIYSQRKIKEKILDSYLSRQFLYLKSKERFLRDLRARRRQRRRQGRRRQKNNTGKRALLPPYGSLNMRLSKPLMGDDVIDTRCSGCCCCCLSICPPPSCSLSARATCAEKAFFEEGLPNPPPPLKIELKALLPPHVREDDDRINNKPPPLPPCSTIWDSENGESKDRVNAMIDDCSSKSIRYLLVF